MDTTVDSKAERVEAPERIWVPKATLDMGGGSIYIGQAWDDNDTEYIRVDRAPNTRQRAEQAAERWFSETGADPNRVNDSDLKFALYEKQERLADIIAAEFEKVA